MPTATKQHVVTFKFLKTTVNYHVYSSGNDPMFPANTKLYFAKSEIGEVPPPTQDIIIPLGSN